MGLSKWHRISIWDCYTPCKIYGLSIGRKGQKNKKKIKRKNKEVLIHYSPMLLLPITYTLPLGFKSYITYEDILRRK